MRTHCIQLIIVVPMLTSFSSITTQPCHADDWVTYQHDFAHTGRSSANFDPTLLVKAWETRDYTRPIVVGNSLYAIRAVAQTTTIGSFDLLTGKQNWARAVNGTFAPDLSYAEGLLVAATDPNTETKLHVISAATGLLKYSVDLAVLGYLPSAPAIGRNAKNQLVAYIDATYNMGAIELGESAGKILWTQADAGGTQSNPTIVGSSIISGTFNGHRAYDQLTGAVRTLSGGRDLTVPYDTARSQYYVPDTSTGHLIAYSYASDGSVTEKWRSTVLGTSAAIAADGSVIRSTNDSIYKLDPTDGHILASVSGLELSTTYTPVLSANSIFVYGDADSFRPTTEVFNLNTLDHITSLPAGRTNSNTPVRNPGVIFDAGYIVQRSTGFELYLAIPEPSPAFLVLFAFLLSTALRFRSAR